MAFVVCKLVQQKALGKPFSVLVASPQVWVLALACIESVERAVR